MKFKSLQKKKRAGFTLVEMVIVVTILGILSGIGFMKFGNVQETSRKNADYVTAANLATATSLYISEHPKEVEISDKDNEKIKMWVVDQQASTKKELVGYECSCGAVKGK